MGDAGKKRPERTSQRCHRPVLCLPIVKAEERQSLAAEAVKTLRQAIEAGWRDAGRTSRDTGLHLLRDRDDFRRLVGALFDSGFPADPFARR